MTIVWTSKDNKTVVSTDDVSVVCVSQKWNEKRHTVSLTVKELKEIVAILKVRRQI